MLMMASADDALVKAQTGLEDTDPKFSCDIDAAFVPVVQQTNEASNGAISL